MINARFVKPLDTRTILRAVRGMPVGGHGGRGRVDGRVRQRRAGSGHDAGLDASHIRRLGIPDRFIEHGDRDELLADLGLDAAGIADACRELRPETRVRSLSARRLCRDLECEGLPAFNSGELAAASTDTHCKLLPHYETASASLSTPDPVRPASRVILLSAGQPAAVSWPRPSGCGR